mmetsp:Transcript_2181/g.7029  ORF Transcript_2181/g.7029 Transcript_2181/m.7029 type:complete len:212 (+) Transcript_2181:506-1141(+)
MSTMAHGVSPSTSSSCFGATVPTAPAEWLTSSSSSPPAGMQSRGAASPPCGAADCAASLATAAERSPDRSAPEAASRSDEGERGTASEEARRRVRLASSPRETRGSAHSAVQESSAWPGSSSRRAGEERGKKGDGGGGGRAGSDTRTRARSSPSTASASGADETSRDSSATQACRYSDTSRSSSAHLRSERWMCASARHQRSRWYARQILP